MLKEPEEHTCLSSGKMFGRLLCLTGAWKLYQTSDTHSCLYPFVLALAPGNCIKPVIHTQLLVSVCISFVSLLHLLKAYEEITFRRRITLVPFTIVVWTKVGDVHTNFNENLSVV
jgi:hypothetical protein